MKADSMILFSQIIQAQNIHVLTLDSSLTMLYKADLELRCKLYTNYDFEYLKHFILSHCKDNILLKLKDEFSLVFYIIPVPYKGTESGLPAEGETVYLLAGPVLDAPLTASDIQKIMVQRRLPDNLFKDLQIYYGSVPVPPDHRALESTILSVANSLFEQSYKLLTLPEDGDSPLEASDAGLKLKESPSIAIQTLEDRYEVEDRMLDAIASGDQANAVRYHSLFRNFRITPRDENLIINKKNLMLVFNTLCRKAVQKAHVHPVYIDDLSTRFAIAINQAHSMGELDALDNDMIHKYCLLVRNHAMPHYSQMVQRCIIYTDFHYAEPLTLSFFADLCHVTKPYLSNSFKKETGTNLTDYIHSVRIRHALVLLNSTQMPVHVVAVSCGYTDINYFIKMFKRINGTSPRQYRNQMTQS